MKRVLILSFLILSFLQAQVLNKIKFDGLIHLSQEVASEIIELQKGDFLDIEIVDNAVKKLYKQGYFKDIWVEDVGSGDIIFHFIEKPTVANVELEGIGSNDREIIRDFLEMKKGEVFDDEKATFSKLRIVKFYEAKGYFDTVVEHEVEVLSDRAIKVTFLINRGEKIFIKSVTLYGAKNLKYSDIEPKVANKEAEWIPWMWGFNDGKLMLHDLQYDSDRIKDVYMEYGYLDANISVPFLKAHMDNYEATIAYTVNEGEQYRVGLMELILPESLKSLEKLKGEQILESGDVFDIEHLRRDMKALKVAAGNLGYAYARVVPDIDKNSKDALVNVHFRVIPGDKVYINNVIISGNSRTIDRVIRRDIFLAKGDLYRTTDILDTKGALGRSGYFKSIDIEEKRVARNKIDLIVKVEEASTGSISGGIGYGSSDGILLSAKLSDANIFGSGMTASVGVERRDKELSGNISLYNPRLFDSIYSLGGSIYKRYAKYYYNSTRIFNATTTGFSITTGRRIARHWGVYLGYVLEDKQYSYKNNNMASYNYFYTSLLKSSIIPSISYNTTDNYQLARRGIKFKTSLEYAGVGGDAKFAKNITRFNYYYGLRDDFKYDLILRYKMKFYNIYDNGFIPVDEYLAMGGVGTVRGYRSGYIGPTKKIANGAYYNGDMMLINTIEASFPLIKRLQMRGAIFFDYGMIGIGNLNAQKRAGTGVVLEWLSPLGPISFIFAHPLLKKDGDKTSGFEFTIGREF